jgi:hypothetical protein
VQIGEEKVLAQKNNVFSMTTSILIELDRTTAGTYLTPLTSSTGLREMN